MTDESKTQKPKIENLELNRETLQDLSEQEGNGVRGGLVPQTRTCDCVCTVDISGCW